MTPNHGINDNLPWRSFVRFGVSLVGVLGVGIGVAQAHPLGMTSVNRYAGLRLDAEGVEIAYLLDFAELPAYAEIELLDADHDGAVTAPERERYLDGLLARITPTLSLTIDGLPVVLRTVSSGLEAPPGQNGLSTLRVAVLFHTPRPTSTGDVAVVLEDPFSSARAGWRELDALDSQFGRVVSSSLPRGGERAGASLAYPQSAPSSPLREDLITAVFQPLEGTGLLSGLLGLASPAGAFTSEGSRLAALVRTPEMSVAFLLFAFGLAFLLGAGHALSPGHGKILVGSYLVGARARPRDAVILGLSVTATHTASVFLLGFLALAIEHSLGSDRLLRILELVSGVLVVAIAVSQLPGRVRRLAARTAAPDEILHEHSHDHASTHHHDHLADDDITHNHGDGHVHTHRGESSPHTLRGLVALGVSGGLVPCPAAIVVLLTALSLKRLVLGLGLLVAFSAGLAMVLTALAMLFVLGRQRLEKVALPNRLGSALPVVSSCLVLLLGIGIVAKSW